jgi:hypothetical protein
VTTGVPDPSDIKALEARIDQAERQVSETEPQHDSQDHLDALIDLAMLQEQLMQTLRQARGPDDYAATWIESELGCTRLLLGDVKDAVEISRDVLERLQRTVGPEAEATLLARQQLARAVQTTGAYRRLARVEKDLLAARTRQMAMMSTLIGPAAIWPTQNMSWVISGGQRNCGPVPWPDSTNTSGREQGRPSRPAQTWLSV